MFSYLQSYKYIEFSSTELNKKWIMLHVVAVVARRQQARQLYLTLYIFWQSNSHKSVGVIWCHLFRDCDF